MTEPPDGLSPGIIGRNGAARLEVPASAMVGDTITVAVYTWVGGTVGPGEVQVDRERNTVVIRPFDHFGVGFLDQDSHYRREVQIVVENAVPLQIVVIGRSMPGYRPFRRVFTVRVAH